MKSRGVYETPGGTILYRAHEALETLTLDRDTAAHKKLNSIKYGDLVYNGQWFTPLREALDLFFDSTQQVVTGSVRMKLYKGHALLAGVKSPYSLYSSDLASFTMGNEYDATDATGFIRLLGLPLKVRAAIKNEAEKKAKKKASKKKK
jgi:argininosuccinate synthase